MGPLRFRNGDVAEGIVGCHWLISYSLVVASFLERISFPAPLGTDLVPEHRILGVKAVVFLINLIQNVQYTKKTMQ